MLLGIAKKLFEYLRTLEKSLTRKNYDKGKSSWLRARQEMIKIICEYAPSRSELIGSKILLIKEFKTYEPWRKALREGVLLGDFEWSQIVRILNQTPELLEFRSRFLVGTQDWKGFVDLCREVDYIRPKSTHYNGMGKKAICFRCNKEGHVKKDFKLKRNDSGLFKET